jgi:MYXO-CTERM domain-containing protein
VCDPVSKTCKPECQGVVCPVGQKCQDGKCVDLCANLICPAPKTCIGGECKAPCTCFAGDVGCPSPLVCDKNGSGQCVPAACKGKSCNAGEHCNDAGDCVGLCDGVVCPQGQKCDSQKGCVPMCDGVSCQSGQECDPTTGTCVDKTCSPACNPPLVCVAGSCVLPESGSGGSGTGATGATTGDAGPDASAGSGGVGASKGGTSDAGDDGGCGCRTPGSDERGTLALLSVLGALGLGFARRRSTRSHR